MRAGSQREGGWLRFGRACTCIITFCAVAFAPNPSDAGLRPLTSAEKKVVGKRLAHVVNYRRSVKIEEGDTLFVVHRVKVRRKRVRGNELDYEAIVDGVRAPKGISIDERVDNITIRSARKNRLEVTFRYAINVLPGTRRGGRVNFKLKLIAREGLSGAVLTVPLSHKVKVRPAKPSAVDLAADFHGHRIYKKLAHDRLKALARKGIKGLSMRANARIPAIVGVGRQITSQVAEFDKWRRRMWIAYRHLLVAKSLADRALAAQAKTYLDRKSVV